MIGSTQSNSRKRKLLLSLLVLMLALALPAAVLAQPGSPPGVDPGSPPGNPDPNQPTPAPTATVPTGPPDGGPDGPPATATPTPDNGGMNGDDNMMMGPRAHELANRIVKHVATPVQFVTAGEGFQFFFIGADGSTVSGPTLPSFAELAEMHPSGEWVSLLDAVNPLTGKQVYVDYIPKDMTIRTFTYYPDKGMDVNKPYIFNFGADLAVNVEAW